MRAYVYWILTCQVEARSTILGSSASAVNVKHALKRTLDALINEDYSISVDIDRYQGCFKAWIITRGFFSKYRHLYASKWFKIEHRKNGGIWQ